MSILVDLSTTPYNNIRTRDEFNEKYLRTELEFNQEYKKSVHLIELYRLIEFIVLSFLNKKFAENPIDSRGSINIKPYTLKFIFNADYSFDMNMDEYFKHKLKKCYFYDKTFLEHKTTDLTIEENMSLFLNLQSLTPNTQVKLTPVETNDYFRLFAFSIKYNNLREFLFHMTTNMFFSTIRRTINDISVICKEQSSGSVLAPGDMGCFVIALWAAGLINTYMYLKILQGFEYILERNGSNNDAVMFTMNLFLTQTLIRLYNNKNTTIKVFEIPYIFNDSDDDDDDDDDDENDDENISHAVYFDEIDDDDDDDDEDDEDDDDDGLTKVEKNRLNNIVDKIVNDIETLVKELLKQLEFSSRNLFNDIDGSIGNIKVPLITLIRYTPNRRGFGHTFNLIIEGNSLNPKISIADFYENKAITTRCKDETLKYKNVLLQRKYSAKMSSNFLYTYEGKEYDNVLPIAPLNSDSIISILKIQRHIRDNGNFQLFCEVTTDVKDGKPFFNIDPKFLLNNDKSVTRAKEFLSGINSPKYRVKKYVKTVKNRVANSVLAIKINLAQQFALSVLSTNMKKDDVKMIMDNRNFDCNLSLKEIDIPSHLRGDRQFKRRIDECIVQQNTPLIILVGRIGSNIADTNFTDTIFEIIINLLNKNCVDINYENSNKDTALTILLTKTNAILEDLNDDDDDGYDEEYKTILRTTYNKCIDLALRIIHEGVYVNNSKNGKNKSKQLLEELLNKGDALLSKQQKDNINIILHTPPPPERIEEHDTTKGGSYAPRIRNSYILRSRRPHPSKLSKKKPQPRKLSRKKFK